MCVCNLTVVLFIAAVSSQPLASSNVIFCFLVFFFALSDLRFGPALTRLHQDGCCSDAIKTSSYAARRCSNFVEKKKKKRMDFVLLLFQATSRASKSAIALMQVD